MYAQCAGLIGPAKDIFQGYKDDLGRPPAVLKWRLRNKAECFGQGLLII